MEEETDTRLDLWTGYLEIIKASAGEREKISVASAILGDFKA